MRSVLWSEFLFADWPLRLGSGRLAQRAGRLPPLLASVSPNVTSHCLAISPVGAGEQKDLHGIGNWSELLPIVHGRGLCH